MAKILGVRIDNLKKKEILRKIEEFLDEPKFHQIVTVNPEFILEAQKNQEFKETLNESELSIADGFGISCAFFYNLEILKCRLTGVELLEEILKIAERRRVGIFLACRKDGLTSFEEAKEKILEKYPQLKVGGVNLDLLGVRPLLNRGRTPNCEVLICNFGAPKQELFIKSLKNDSPPHLFKKSGNRVGDTEYIAEISEFLGLQNKRCGGKIRLAIGVGGALDFMSGKIKRAPRFMRVLGLEWLWRFIQEPKYRFPRIFRAVIIFPIRVIINK